MGFGILTAVKIQIAAIWFVTSYRLVDGYQCFVGTLKMVGALFSEKLETIYQTSHCRINYRNVIYMKQDLYLLRNALFLSLFPVVPTGE
jgi:hypothetical protein